MHYKAEQQIRLIELKKWEGQADRIIRAEFGREIGLLLAPKLTFSLPENPFPDFVSLGEQAGSQLVWDRHSIETEFIFMTMTQWEEVKRKLEHIEEFPNVGYLARDVIKMIEAE